MGERRGRGGVRGGVMRREERWGRGGVRGGGRGGRREGKGKRRGKRRGGEEGGERKGKQMDHLPYLHNPPQNPLIHTYQEKHHQNQQKPLPWFFRTHP